MALLKYKCAECGADIFTTSFDKLEYTHGTLIFCCQEHMNNYAHRQTVEQIKARMAEDQRKAEALWDNWQNQMQKEANEKYAKHEKIAKEKYERSHKDTVSVDGVLYSSDRLWLVEVPKDTRTFEVPEGVTEICFKAFAECENLTTVKLPQTLKIIDQEAFLNCKNLSSITIPASVTKICDGAFENCESLKDLVIPEGVSELGGNCFYSCSSLESVSIPKSIKKIGCGENLAQGLGQITIKGLFGYCRSLSTVILPEGMEEIATGMFHHCSALKTISIPETVTKIGECAFYYSGLEAITIPASVTEIEDCAFQFCHNLQSVEYLGEEPTIGENVFVNCGFEKEQEKRESKQNKIKDFILCPFRNLMFWKNKDITIGGIISAVLWFFAFGILNNAGILDLSFVKVIILSVLVSYLAKTIPDMIFYKGNIDGYHSNIAKKLWDIVYSLLSFFIPVTIIILHKFFDFF